MTNNNSHNDLFKFSIGDTLIFKYKAPNNYTKTLVVDRVLDITENIYLIKDNKYIWHKENHFTSCRMVLIEKLVEFPEQFNFPKPRTY